MPSRSRPTARSSPAAPTARSISCRRRASRAARSQPRRRRSSRSRCRATARWSPPPASAARSRSSTARRAQARAHAGRSRPAGVVGRLLARQPHAAHRRHRPHDPPLGRLTGDPIGDVAIGGPDDPLARLCRRSTAREVFRACVACHTLTPDEGNRAGPTLAGIFGRRIATLPGYNFSPRSRSSTSCGRRRRSRSCSRSARWPTRPAPRCRSRRSARPRTAHALVKFLEKATKKYGVRARSRLSLLRSRLFLRARADNPRWCAPAGARRADRDRNPPRSRRSTRQSSHILMTSSRVAEPLNIQCLPSSLAATRSIVLLTPNGLPQRMQANGSSSLSTRARRGGGAEIELRLERDDLLRAGRLAQPALHAGVLGKAQHRPLGIVADSAPVGQADTQARQSVQPSTLTSTAPNGAPAGSATMSTGAGAARCSSRSASRITSRLAPTGGEARRAARAGASARSRAALAERIRIVGLDGGDARAAKAEAGQDRLGQRDGLAQARRRRGAAWRAAGSARRTRHRRTPPRPPPGRPASPR